MAAEPLPLGWMAVPADFRYMRIYLQGKPQHERFDAFRLRHPSMPVSQRAKLFAPFDALRGFDFAIMETEALHLQEASSELTGLPSS